MKMLPMSSAPRDGTQIDCYKMREGQIIRRANCSWQMMGPVKRKAWIEKSGSRYFVHREKDLLGWLPIVTPELPDDSELKTGSHA